jgi:hypothetical protein
MVPSLLSTTNTPPILALVYVLSPGFTTVSLQLRWPRGVMAYILVTAEHSYLSQNLFHHVAVDVGEAEVAALVAVGEPFVVDAELVQDGGLQVVDMHWIFGDVDAVVVGLAIGHSAAHAANNQPLYGVKIRALKIRMHAM